MILGFGKCGALQLIKWLCLKWSQLYCSTQELRGRSIGSHRFVKRITLAYESRQFPFCGQELDPKVFSGS